MSGKSKWSKIDSGRLEKMWEIEKEWTKTRQMNKWGEGEKKRKKHEKKQKMGFGLVKYPHGEITLFAMQKKAQ